MRMQWLALALVAVAGVASAKTITCDIESDYDLAITPKSVILTRDSGVPKTIVMRQGELFVDDRWARLSAGDRARVAAYEREARAVMPLAQQIGRDAAAIAFTTLGEVAAGFSSDPARTRTQLAQARTRIDTRLARSVTATRFNGADLGEGIGEAVREVMPLVIGDIVGGAVRAAFGGDITRLKQMEDMDRVIEARIQPRAQALERNAENLCRRMEGLDRIDNALDYRLPNGDKLDLLRISQFRHLHD